MQESRISLSTLNTMIREATDDAFPQSIWVVAEILELQVNRRGHCYLELVEKAEDDNRMIARIRATIWASKFNMIKAYFESSTGTPFSAGIKVLLKVQVNFHELYGLSLNISDLDPAFTLGDIALKRKEVLAKLKASGVMEMNQELLLPEIPNTIAVISSESAAGYGDFIDTLLHNPYGFTFEIDLFPATVQGDAAESSIINALELIYAHEKDYDAIALIRGGGSQADLQCFDQYDLALNIAQFPIPVITGIGHDRDISIADLVAYKSLKTPTAAAEFFIETLLDFSSRLHDLKDSLELLTNRIIQNERLLWHQRAGDLKLLGKQALMANEHHLKEINTRLISSLKADFSRQYEMLQENAKKMRLLWKGFAEDKKRDLKLLNETVKRSATTILKSNTIHLNNLEKNLDLLRPEKVLSRGYSITYNNGKAVKSKEDLKHGDMINTQLSDGTITSRVEEMKPKTPAKSN